MPKGRLRRGDGVSSGGLVFLWRGMEGDGGGGGVMEGEEDILSMVRRDEESPRNRKRGDGAEA